MASVNYDKLISRGAILGLIGFVLSGPVAVLIVSLTHPQPLWVSPEVFVDNYHIIQNLPYFLGFFILGGMLLFSAGHYLSYTGENITIRTNLLLALSLTIVFFALIAFNYICQTTFIHNLSTHYRQEYDALIAGFSMSNPSSFCWANEMWGYGVLGVATWLIAPYYKGRNNLIRRLLIANGIISLISPIWTIIDVQWVLSAVGFSLYLAWNFLMILIMILVIRHSTNSIA